MKAKVINISDIDESELFKWRQYTLGDQTGRYVVVEGDLFLGIYKNEEDAENHARTLNETK